MNHDSFSSGQALEYTEGVELAFPLDDGDVIYGGAFVCVNAAGYAVPGSDTAGLIFQGVSIHHVDNSLGQDGDKQVVLRRRGLIKATLGHIISQANVGDSVFLVDDQTVDLVANVTNAIFCGVIAGFIGANQAWIDIEPAFARPTWPPTSQTPAPRTAASAISVADAGAFTAEATVEAALQELYGKTLLPVADPGHGLALPANKIRRVSLTTGATGQTRTLAAPAAAGLMLTLCLGARGW
jgi:hypothetical protein